MLLRTGSMLLRWMPYNALIVQLVCVYFVCQSLPELNRRVVCDTWKSTRQTTPRPLNTLAASGIWCFFEKRFVHWGQPNLVVKVASSSVTGPTIVVVVRTDHQQQEWRTGIFVYIWLKIYVCQGRIYLSLCTCRENRCVGMNHVGGRRSVESNWPNGDLRLENHHKYCIAKQYSADLLSSYANLRRRSFRLVAQIKIYRRGWGTWW